MKCFAVYEQPRPGAPYHLITWQKRRKDLEAWITDPMYGRIRAIFKGDSRTLPTRLLIREARKLRQEGK